MNGMKRLRVAQLMSMDQKYKKSRFRSVTRSFVVPFPSGPVLSTLQLFFRFFAASVRACVVRWRAGACVRQTRGPSVDDERHERTTDRRTDRRRDGSEPRERKGTYFVKRRSTTEPDHC